jgi:hypothetical protein
MQGKFATNFEKVKASFPFQLRDYQLNILQRVFTNVENEKKSQTIMLPVGAGKSVLAQLFALSFAESGYKVLMVTEMNQKYIYEQNSLIKDYVASGLIRIEMQTRLWESEIGHVDVVIADVVRAMMDPSLQLQNIIDGAELALQRSSYKQLSIGQQSALGMKKIYDILNTQGAYYIEFESTQGQQILHSPIVALKNCVSIQPTEEELTSYRQTLVQETDWL